MNVCRVCSCAGEYSLTGVWVSETQTWALSPGVWLTNPCGYGMVGFNGTIDVVAGLRRFSGRVREFGAFSFCSNFTLMESTGTAPSSCTSSRTLILGIPTVPNSLARTILSGTAWYPAVPLWSSGADILLRRWCRMPPTRMFTTDFAGPPKPIVGTAAGKVVLQGYSRVLQGFVLPRRVMGLNQ
jgi:hypothetical protein